MMLKLYLILQKINMNNKQYQLLYIFLSFKFGVIEI